MNKNVEMRFVLPFLFKCESRFGTDIPSRSDDFTKKRRIQVCFLAHVLALILLAVSIPASAQNTTSIKLFHDCSDCPEMITIPPGIFMMGASKEEVDRFNRQSSLLERLMSPGVASEQPQHRVAISRAFALGKYPVTRGEFTKFIHETGYNANTPCTVRARGHNLPASGASWSNPGFTQTDRDPVVCVTWADANAYVGWLNKKTKSSAGTAKAGLYRLPSEAEYEYAARGGTTTLRWWGDEIGRNKAVCDGCGSPWDGQQPAPVGLYGPNSYGVSDILGNVQEWMEDCWNKNYEQAPADGSPWSVGDCKLRVMRGGSWQSQARLVTSALRSNADQDSADFHLGFRVAKSLQ